MDTELTAPVSTDGDQPAGGAPPPRNRAAEWLHETVIDRVGVAIVSGHQEPGSVMRAEELGARFGVSRSVVREAVRVLETLNVVQSRRGVGITVRPRAEWSLLDPRLIRWRLAGPERHALLEQLGGLRAAIEPEAARSAAEHATGEQCARLVGAVMGMVATGRQGDLAGYLEHDLDFHTSLLEASGNELFRALGGVVCEVLAGRTRHGLMPPVPDSTALRLHRDVADAIQMGDAEAAEAAMRALVIEARAAVARVLGAQPPPQ